MSAAPARLDEDRKGPRIEELSVALFQRIAAIMLADAGITLPETKMSLVHSRVSKRLRALNLTRFEEYCAFVESKNGAEERRHLISALTTNVTRFFREPHHFEDLRDNVLPNLISRARQGGRVRIWSAACSSGEEAYSIALTVLSLAPDIGNRDFKILATDIDPVIVAKARRGIYPADGLKDVPADLRSKYFEPVSNDSGRKAFRVGEALKALITFKEMNLIKAWPVKGPFDAIFCRNVVIYFSSETSQKVWQDFSECLAPEGRLYIGHSERVTGRAEARFEGIGVTTYKLKSAG